MKKVIALASLIFFCAPLFAQTIDTMSLKPYAIVKIVVPFSPKWGDTVKAHYMMVEIKDDNIKDKAVFRYVLFQKRWTESEITKTADGKSDSTINVQRGGAAIIDGYLNCDGADYKNWDGNDRTYPFKFSANKLGIAIK